MKIVKKYPDDFKIKVVQHYLESGESYEVTAKLFGLPGSARVRNWVEKSRNESEGPEWVKWSKYNPNHSDNFKSEVVRYYLESDDSIHVTAKKFKVTDKTVKNWVEKSQNGSNQSYSKEVSKFSAFYSDEFKIKVVCHYMESDDGFTKTAEKFNLPSAKSVSNWVAKFRGKIPAPTMHQTLNQNCPAIPLDDKPIVEPNSVVLSSDMESIAHHIRQLELKIIAANTMIDIAEKEFSISIRKKSGAKQLRK